MDNQQQVMQQIIAKCWTDEQFKQQLMDDPVGTLKQEGIELPEGMRINVLEDSDQTANLVIPARPEGVDDDELDSVAAGFPGMSDGQCPIGFLGK